MSVSAAKRIEGSTLLSPTPDRLDHALPAQLVERRIGTLQRFPIALVGSLLRAMGEHVDIVDQEDVDRSHAEPAVRLLDRAQDAVATEVVGRPEVQAAGTEPLARIARAQGAHPAPDLGRQHEALAWQEADRLADPKLGAAVAVIGRGVEQTKPGVVGGADRADRLVLGDDAAKAAERRRAEAELGDPERRLAELPPGEGIVAHVSSLLRGSGSRVNSSCGRCTPRRAKRPTETSRRRPSPAAPANAEDRSTS